ncbi:MAG: neutral/alkaline non-lysosomal ceramidase N-terminal domain-containing protein [Clostridiaceae bacterium]|nr:neutral/alkaline non-lysosomal ceramidase N-terminal domain-containing protein [Clostridiaceae bacterium]
MYSKLTVGVGRAKITPPLGTILFGYAPGRPAESVGDDLYVTAIAIGSGDTQALLLTADLCVIAPQIFADIRDQTSHITGIPSDNIICSTTHTHSGPNTSTHNGWGDPDMPYVENILIPGSLAAAKDAVANRRPALMGIGTTQSDVAANRRQALPDGRIVLGQNPWGLRDTTMTVLSFKDAENDKPIVNLIHYCAHATASGCNPEITRDWPGPMTDMLERESGAMTAFFNGSIGETGPNLPNGQTTGTYKMALELGDKAGIDAVRAWRSIKEWRDSPVHRIADDIKIPYEPLVAKDVALAEMTKLGTEEQLRSQKRFSEINELIRWQNIVHEYVSDQPRKTHYVFHQTILAAGPVVFIPFQFEMFIDMTMRLRNFSKFAYTLCLSNANGSMAYLPSQDQICRGGYEVWYFRYGHTYKLVDDADNYMVSENLRLLNRLFDASQECH